jgi:heat shock protein HtpX
VQAVGLQTYIWNNNIRSALLLAGFPVLLLGMTFFLTLGLIWAGYFPGGVETYGGAVPLALNLMVEAAPAAIIVALVWFAIAYFANDAIIAFATGARPVSREEAPDLYNRLENLCISRGLRMPKLRVIETDGMNAFASGLHEGRFSVTVTRGLLQSLDQDELEAVLAHELTHIINRDVRTMVIAAVFAGVITLFCQIVYRPSSGAGCGAAAAGAAAISASFCSSRWRWAPSATCSPSSSGWRSRARASTSPTPAR